MASFYASELEARSSPSRSASSSACAGASPARRRAVPVAQLWKDAIRAVVADALAEASSPSLSPLPAGKRRARSTMHDDFVDRQSAAGALAMQLDLACVARILASTPERVVSTLKRSARLCISHFVSWSAGYIRTSTNILRKLRSFTSNAKAVDGLQLASFLDSIDREARRKKTKLSSSASAVAPAEVDGFVRTNAWMMARGMFVHLMLSYSARGAMANSLNRRDHQPKPLRRLGPALVHKSDVIVV